MSIVGNVVFPGPSPQTTLKLLNAAQECKTSASRQTIRNLLKANPDAYRSVVDICESQKVRAKVLLNLHRTFYELAATPQDRAIGAVETARVYECQSSLTVTKVLKYGPFIALKRRRERDGAIKWYRRAHQTGKSGSDQSLVRLLMERASQRSVCSSSAVKDHMEALNVAAYALKTGRFFSGHVLALESKNKTPQATTFMARVIRPLLASYQPAQDLDPIYVKLQIPALARARHLVEKL